MKTYSKIDLNPPFPQSQTFQTGTDFRPHWLLRGAHAQTVAGSYLGKRIPYSAQQWNVQLCDGDLIALHDDCPSNWQDGQRVAILLHGLAGCHGSGYMVRIASKLKMRGIRVFRMDMRGCGNSIAANVFNAGRLGDIEAAIKFICKLAPNSPITMTGFSLGGGMALAMAGRADEFEIDSVDRLVTVAPPIDLKACCLNLGTRTNRKYDRFFVKKLLEIAKSPDNLIAREFPLERVSNPKSIFEFDQRITAPFSGYSSVDEYYDTSCAKRVIDRIRIPTLVITAEDDPLIPFHQFRNANFSSSVKFWPIPRGGHLGFLSKLRSLDPDWHWMDWRVVENI